MLLFRKAGSLVICRSLAFSRYINESRCRYIDGYCGIVFDKIIDGEAGFTLEFVKIEEMPVHRVNEEHGPRVGVAALAVENNWSQVKISQCNARKTIGLNNKTKVTGGGMFTVFVLKFAKGH